MHWILVAAVCVGLSCPALAQAPAGRGGVSQSLNPDISALVDFAVQRSRPDGGTFSGNSGLREVELGLQGAVDPYARADVFIAVKPQGPLTEVELEEGYLTTLRLPASLQVRAGRYRPRFGRQNLTHPSELPTVDHPAVLLAFLGDEGFSDVAGGLSWITPLPWYGEVTWDHLNHLAPSGAFPDLGRTEVFHLRNFLDLSAAAGLDLGASWGLGMSGRDVFEGPEAGAASVVGADFTYKWRPPSRALYRSFLAQAEVIRSSTAAYGWYGLAQYQIGRRWYLGARYDWTQAPELGTLKEAGPGVVLSFLPSEFSRVRAQWRRVWGGENQPQHRIDLQVTFGLGPHRPHVF